MRKRETLSQRILLKNNGGQLLASTLSLHMHTCAHVPVLTHEKTMDTHKYHIHVGENSLLLREAKMA